MARPRFEKADPTKQEAILQAAAKEFAQIGYEAASVNRIFESAGLSKGAFYYYFDDKADLACTVTLWAYREIFELYDRLVPPDDPARFWEVLEGFVHESMAMLQRSPHTNALISRLGQAFANDKDLASRLNAIVSKPTGTIIAFWEWGQRNGAVRPDIPVPQLVAVLQGLKESMIRVFMPPGHITTAEELVKLAELQLDLFRRVSVPAQGGLK